MDLTEYPIKLYHNKRIAERIAESLSCYSATEQKKSLTDLGVVLADIVPSIREQIDTKDLEQRMNELRLGTAYEQALYLFFRAHLIENDCMPIDESGKPYDLSLMHIPVFHNDAFLDTLCLDNLELLNKTLHFYQKHKTGNVMSAHNFISCINKMKTVMPAAYVRLYRYLVENDFIPSSPMLSCMSLSEEQFIFLARYEAARADADGRMPVIAYVKEKISGRLTMEKVNRALEEMRHGDSNEQAAYYDFCTLMQGLEQGLQTKIIEIKEERAKLVTAAISKAKAGLALKV